MKPVIYVSLSVFDSVKSFINLVEEYNYDYVRQCYDFWDSL